MNQCRLLCNEEVQASIPVLVCQPEHISQSEETELITFVPTLSLEKAE